jgi:c-di-GMP-binding flagellar brake protein YcgR
MEEKRKNERKDIVVTTVARKNRAEGGVAIMEFQSLDLSMGGIFISTEDLSIFDLGEEVEVLVDAEGAKYYEGKARIVRSVRSFTDSGMQTESGFGLMFLNPDDEFREMLVKRLEV